MTMTMTVTKTMTTPTIFGGKGHDGGSEDIYPGSVKPNPMTSLLYYFDY